MPGDTLVDRIFLYGIRPAIITVVILAGGGYLVVYGALRGNTDYLISGVFIAMIGAGLGIGFHRTETRKITKKYFSPATLVGKQGRVQMAFAAGTKGVVHLENEFWSGYCEQDLQAGDAVEVLSVDPDKVTLRVRRVEK